MLANKQNGMIETGIRDQCWQHFNKDIQGASCIKNYGETIPGVEIVDANSTRQERPWYIQET